MSKLVSISDTLFTTAVRAPSKLGLRWLNIFDERNIPPIDKAELAMLTVFQASQSLIGAQGTSQEFRRRILSRSILIQMCRHNLSRECHNLFYKRCSEYQALLKKDWQAGTAKFPKCLTALILHRLFVRKGLNMDIARLLLVTHFEPMISEYREIFGTIIGYKDWLS